jgi:hypothetical protein
MSLRIETCGKSKPDNPRIWLRIDRNHVAKVIKARRLLCTGESFAAMGVGHG